MTSVSPQTTPITIRSFQYRDLEAVDRLVAELTQQDNSTTVSDTVSDVEQQAQRLHHWYGALKILSLFPNPLQHFFLAYVAEWEGQLCGLIQVSPFNRTRSTWRVDRILTRRGFSGETPPPLALDIGTQLLRHCFQTIWEARTWMIEANIEDKDTLALYRHNGFQPLARMTYWSIPATVLQVLAEREPDLPNLLPVGNADAGLLHQLDTASMPPLVRQVFDRHVADFKTSLVGTVANGLKHWMRHTEWVRNYVFEPQRKVAIGYFQLQICKDGKQPHAAQLTVNPAYTWLYPELLSQMAHIVKAFPPQALRLASSDYQLEREEYLELIGADRIEHTLMMSRSVWHKVRETKLVSLDGLQLSEMLQGFQPNRKPIPERFSFDLDQSKSDSKVRGHEDG